MPGSVHDTPGDSTTNRFSAPTAVLDVVGDPWELTRRISPRDTVRAMVREADGGLHENTYPRLHRLSAPAPSTPWATRLADASGRFRLLCFDFDTKAGGTERAIDDCDELSGILEEHLVAHVVCRSSAGGGRHLWVAVHDGASAEIVGELATAAKAHWASLDHGMLHNPAEGSARPPGSPHRDGSASRVLRGDLAVLLQPTTSSADVELLRDLLQATAPADSPARTLPSGPIDLVHRDHRELTAWAAGHMATIGGGANPSWTGFMCLLGAASAGWTLSDVQRAAASAPGMEHYRTKNDGRGGRRPRSAAEASIRLERQWARALEFNALHQALPHASKPPADLTELDQLLADVEQVVQSFRITPGRWGASSTAMKDRAILTALAYLTLTTGKRSVAASIRQLALLSGLGRSTAWRALHHLRDAGFVERVRVTDGMNASEWRLAPRLSTGTSSPGTQLFHNPRPPAVLFPLRTVLVAQLEHDLVDARHDLWTHHGHGHDAGRVYASVPPDHSPVTVTSIATALGFTQHRAGVLLSKLRRSRLLTKAKAGWVRAKRDLRDWAAVRLGVDGTLDARATRYAAEREVWTWWLAEVDTMNTPPAQRPRRPHVSARPLFMPAEMYGDTVMPRYPRNAEGRADHPRAREYVDAGYLAATQRWRDGAEAIAA